VRRFATGLGKKVLIANTMGTVADAVLSASPAVGAIPAWFAFVAYTFQIYFDFSGYSDMAIGLGRMLGFHFLENFNYPYIARSVTEFWRRWHISLSSFFRDYLYIPLGGNRVPTRRWLLNLAVVWGLTGLWHGASWNFVCWGLYHGLLLMGERLFWGRSIGRRHRALQHAYTMFLVVVGWVIFRVESLALVAGWLGALFGAHGWGSVATLNAINVLHLYPWFAVAAVGATPLAARTLRRLESTPVTAWLHDAALFGVLLWSIVTLATSGFNPFIYFRF
jgi:alginate O-acetyltransferase complex protein AlgI